MGDIATTWTANGGDWLLNGASLANDDGLHTAVLLSLFTDRLAQPGDVLPDAAQGLNTTPARRGWWADAYADTPGDLVGSRLWLLAREKQRTEVLRRAEEYAREALQWLVDDGIAAQVNVLAEVPREAVLALTVTVKRSATPVASYRFETFWKGA